MNSRSSGGWLEGLFTGKGFYIVLFLCAAVIGGSAWMLAAGKGTMAEDAMPASNNDTHTVETVILPPQQDRIPVLREDTEAAAPASREEEEKEQVQEVFGETEAEPDSRYLWPVSGQLLRRHDPDALIYDETMGDWRTHQGIDILAPLGETVTAAHGGTVESITHDDLMGVIVTVSHGDGVCTVYAGMAEELAVSVGDRVEPGTVLGAVGETALGETALEPHLHFGVRVYGVDKDPLDYLPA